MDDNRFDALAKLIGEPTTRRLAVRSLSGGAFGAVLGLLGWHGGEDTSAHDAIKKCKKLKGAKKKACLKKAKQHNASHSNPSSTSSPPSPLPSPIDQAPPCTTDSCPLPPECSQQALEDCTASRQDEWLTDAEPCRNACQDPEATECQDCLAPIVATWLPQAQACAAQACGPAVAQATARSSSPRSRERSAAQAGNQVSAQSWWVRQCPTSCCYLDYAACKEDVEEEWAICMIGAVGAFIAGPAGGLVALGCMAKLAYDDAKCTARYACPEGSWCKEGDVCCPHVDDFTCNGQCCHGDSYECCGGACREKASGPWTPCGTTCCSGSAPVCVNAAMGRCCTEADKCGTDCCGGGRVCCNGTCCSFGKICDGGTCKCPSGRLECAGTCCHAAAVGCDGSRCLNQCDIDRNCGG